MGRVCAVKGCCSGSAADSTRRRKDNIKKPRFFKVPKCPTERQKWIESLCTELNDCQYVCDLHFESNAIQHFYLTNLPNGEVNKIAKGRVTLAQGTVPLKATKIQYPINEECKQKTVFLKKISNPINEECQKNPVFLKKISNPINEECQKKTVLLKKISKNTELECRLPVKREISLPDENGTPKCKKSSKHEIENKQSQINLDTYAEIQNSIIELNKLFPIGWCFIPGNNQLIAIQFDCIELKERLRLVINSDKSVLVTILKRHEKKMDVEIKSVADLIDFIKSIKQKILCTGTGFDSKSYSLKCHGDVSDIYKYCKACPRCPECKKLRLKLQKIEKDGTPNTVNEITRRTSKDTNIELLKKAKRIQQQIQTSTSILRSIKKQTKTMYESQFNKKLSLLPKQQQLTVRMCFENSNRKGPNGRRYEVEWIYECLLIRMKSTCTYNMIRARNIIPLPTVDTLSKYVQKLNSSIFGFLPETFEVLRKKRESMAAEDKIGQISVDEVELLENVEFNKKIAEYTGFVELEKYTSKSDSDVAEDHALVFMFVPYRGNSAQPLGCFITKNSITSEVLHKLFLECIILVENAGFVVRSLVTDAAQWNRGVWTKSGIDTNNITCEHPCDPSRKLWMISDFPHLVKRFRNSLVE